jgi:cellulose synthase/poly-beta-1,6-N-acetylglucosamine synthase-like glycosyltransferase
MTAFEVLLLLPSLAYAITVWNLGSRISTWNPEGEPAEDNSPSGDLPFQSVIIAARNEAKDLPQTLASLLKQDRPLDSFEVLVVSDRSEDATLEILEQTSQLWQQRGATLRYFDNSPEGGKKRAITLACSKAKAEFISVLDADCTVGAQWLNSLGRAFESQNSEAQKAQDQRPIALVAAPARFSGRATLLQRLIRLEYIGFLGAGLGSMETSHPLYASGANLSWRKSAFQSVGGYKGLEHIASADDTLLIQRLHLAGRFRFKALFGRTAAIETRGPESLFAFCRQRVRWTSTEFSFEDKSALLASITLYTVFAITALALLAPALGLLSSGTATLLFLLKFLPDLRLVNRCAAEAHEQKSMRLFPLVWLGQLLYGLVLPWFGTFSKVKWRENEL